MSILDDNIDEQFERSFTFLKHKWAKMGALYTLRFSQVDCDGRPILDKIRPDLLYYSVKGSLIWLGTLDDGFLLITFDQFTQYNKLRSEYVSVR